MVFNISSIIATQKALLCRVFLCVPLVALIACAPADKAPINEKASMDDTNAPSASQLNAGQFSDTQSSIQAGQARYQAGCGRCHEAGLLGAPKRSDSNAWQVRMQKGLPTLYAHAQQGFGKMPAQAKSETDKVQVAAAVDYMLQNYISNHTTQNH